MYGRSLTPGRGIGVLGAGCWVRGAGCGMRGAGCEVRSAGLPASKRPKELPARCSYAPDRCFLIWLVRPASVSFTTKRRLAERFPEMTRQGITKHLQVLSAAGVIDGSRQGREHVWALNPTRLAEGRRRLERIALGWDDALARLKMHVDGS